MNGVAIALSAFLACTVRAQATKIVVPQAYEKKAGQWVALFVGHDATLLPVHEQIAYDTSLLPAKVLKLQGMAFREAQHHGFYNARIKNVTTVTMSTVASSPANLSLEFNKNIGKDRVVVFAGTVDWPASSRVTYKPFSLARIQFSRPFLYIPRKQHSLVIDAVTTKGVGAGWVVDAVMGFHPVLHGKYFWQLNYTGFYCRDSRGKYVGSVIQDNRQMTIGGAYAPRYKPVPPNTVGIASVGLAGVGATWGGKKLPIALPGAPGCYWAIVPLHSWAYVTSPTGEAIVPALAIPHDRRLIGKTFYDQPAFLDARANKLGLVTSWSTKWTIGEGEPVAWIGRYKDSTPGASHAQVIHRTTAPILELTY